jgi:hypothetical protein
LAIKNGERKKDFLVKKLFRRLPKNTYSVSLEYIIYPI